MKIRISILAMLVSVALFACNSPAEQQAEEETVTEVSSAPSVSGAFAIEAGSTLGWKGSKAVGDEHIGTIDITEGSLTLAEGVVTGGSFTVDMTTIKNIDVESEEYNAKLVGHLKSDDFFGVESHPTASFTITDAQPATGDEGNYSITGDLTIKGITHELSFPAQIDVTEDGVSAKATTEFDRSKYDVKFGSTNFFEDLVGDKVINNEIEISLDFAAKAAQS